MGIDICTLLHSRHIYGRNLTQQTNMRTLSRSRHRCTYIHVHQSYLLGLFQPELYKKEMLARQTSSDSSGTGEMEYCGKLHFALRYDSEIEGLVVKVTNHFKKGISKFKNRKTFFTRILLVGTFRRSRSARMLVLYKAGVPELEACPCAS